MIERQDDVVVHQDGFGLAHFGKGLGLVARGLGGRDGGVIVRVGPADQIVRAAGDEVVEEGHGVRIVGAPAHLGDLVFDLLDFRVVDLPFGRGDGHVDVEVLLPHLLHGLGQLLDGGAGVDHEGGLGEAFAIGVAGLGQQRLGAFGIGDIGKAEGVAAIGEVLAGNGHARGHEAGGRGVGRLQHELDDLLAVQRHGKGLADLEVIDRGLAGIHHGVGGAQRRDDHEGVGFDREARDFRRRNGFDAIDLAGFHGGEGRGRIGDQAEGELVERNRVGVVIFRVLLEDHRFTGVEGGDAEGAGADEGGGVAGPAFGIGFHHILTHREEGGVGQKLHHVGDAGLEGEGQRLVVGSRNGDIALATGVVVLLGADDGIEHRGVHGGGGRIEHAHPGIDEVTGGNGLAVAPLGVAQVERIGQAVLGHVPGFGERGHDVVIGVETDQTLEGVADNGGGEGFGGGAGIVFGALVIDHIGQLPGGEGAGGGRKEGRRQQRQEMLGHAFSPVVGGVGPLPVDIREAAYAAFGGAASPA